MMVWGCFGGTNEGDVAKILENHAIPSRIRFFGQNFIFRQDNDPKHSSKDSLRHLEEEGTLKVLEWLSQNPDLNSIEAVLDREVRKLARPSATNMCNKLQ